MKLTEFQKDLFDPIPTIQASSRAPKFEFLNRYRLALRFDQLLVGLIVLLVTGAFVFSFGVDQGKRSLRRGFKEQNTHLREVNQELRIQVDRLQEHLGLLEAEQSRQAPPQPTAPVPAETRAAVPEGKFTIQVVTYTSDSAATSAIERFLNKGHRAFVIPSGRYRQLCVDGFDSKAAAKRVLGQLKSKGLAPADAYIRLIPSVI